VRPATKVVLNRDRLVGFGLVIVLRSEKEGVKVGDYMYGFTTWEAYTYTVQPYSDGMLFSLRR
jgi:hypothetical protein